MGARPNARTKRSSLMRKVKVQRTEQFDREKERERVNRELREE